MTVAFVAGVWKYTEGSINQLGSPIIKEQFISSDFPIINEVYGKKDKLSNALSKSIINSRKDNSELIGRFINTLHKTEIVKVFMKSLEGQNSLQCSRYVPCLSSTKRAKKSLYHIHIYHAYFSVHLYIRRILALDEILVLFHIL